MNQIIVNKTFLNLKTNNNFLNNLYTNNNQNYDSDSGFDLYFPEDFIIKIGETKLIDLQIQIEMIENEKNIGSLLCPRSSISKTPLILANSIGIIDADYRGNLKVAIKYIPDSDDLYELHKYHKFLDIQNKTNNQNITIEDYFKNKGLSEKDIKKKIENLMNFKIPSFKIKKGTRLFQICKFDGKSFNIKIVNELSQTVRNNSGFGSTGV